MTPIVHVGAKDFSPTNNAPISIAQEMLLENMSEQFGVVPKDTAVLVRSIEDVQILKILAREVIKCKGLGNFESSLLKATEGKIKIPPTERRGTDEAFLRLMGICGDAVIKLMGFDIENPEKYRFRSVALKEKRLEPDVECIPMLEGKGKKIFIEFQGFHDKFIRYRAIANALTGCSHEKYGGEVFLGIVYTKRSYQKAAIDIMMFPNMNPKELTSQISEVTLPDYDLKQLTAIDPRLIVLAPFTVDEQTEITVLSSKCREWKDEITKNYPLEEEREEAIKLTGLFLFSRFTQLTREEMMAMLSFDIKKTVAGMQLFNEGIGEGIGIGEKRGIGIGEKKGRNEGIGLTISKFIEAGVPKNQVMQVASLLGMADVSSILETNVQQVTARV